MTPLLEMTGISHSYTARTGPISRSTVPAVREVDLTVRHGESVGIVGESGSGKSTLAKIICGLLVPSKGTLALEGRAQDLRRSRDRREWWRHVQLVFQDPYTSLNPAMRVGDIVAEPLRMWHRRSWAEARGEANTYLERVGLDAALASARPDSLSGGQRQRVSIARALAVSPRLLVLDESVSALDVSVQAQILSLLHEILRHEDLTYVFISHDIGVIRLVTDRVLVMHEGQVVEECGSNQLTEDAVTHDYTRRLLAAVPRANR